MTRLLRLVVLGGACVAAQADPARADILVTPFLGKTFAAHTTLQTAEAGVDTRKWVFGASAAWLSAGVLGAEADFSYVPHFFDAGQNLSRSTVTTFSGSVLLAAPLSLTRESLRPYLVGGVGVLHAGVDDLISLTPIDRNLMAVTMGAGAIGFITERTGLRFDVRRIRSAKSEAVPTTGLNGARLGFWRATVGVTIRY